MAKRPLVVVENSLLDALLVDQAARAQFAACLDPLAAAPPAKGCSKCRKAAGKDASAYDAAKACLALMSDVRHQELKQLLDADQIYIACRIGGQIKTVSF